MRIVLYFIFIGSLFFVPLFPDKKSVKVSAIQSDNSIDITLYKPLPKEVKKEIEKIVKKKPPKVIKKKVVKKKEVKKKVVKKRIKKIVPKPEVVIPKKIIEVPKEIIETPENEIEEKVEEEREPKIVKEIEKPLLQQNPVIEQEVKKRAKLKAQKDSYYSIIFAQIESKKRYPKKALRFRQEGSVKVSFSILKDGTLQAFKIIEQSEYNIFNKAVKKIFKKLKKFPAPPHEIGVPVDITITIKYDIKN
jgi:protein TonB